LAQIRAVSYRPFCGWQSAALALARLRYRTGSRRRVEQLIQSNDGSARYQDIGAAVQLAGVCIYDGIAVHAFPRLSSSHTEPFLVTPAAWKHNICGARITASGRT